VSHKSDLSVNNNLQEISWCTSSFDTLSVHVIRNIRRKNQISVASNCDIILIFMLKYYTEYSTAKPAGLNYVSIMRWARLHLYTLLQTVHWWRQAAPDEIITERTRLTSSIDALPRDNYNNTQRQRRSDRGDGRWSKSRDSSFREVFVSKLSALRRQNLGVSNNSNDLTTSTDDELTDSCTD